MTHTVAERYLRLGLQVGRHVDGIVDAYFGPPELGAAVDAEAPVDPRALLADAEALLDELEDGWLRDQVAGLRTYAGALAGESGSYADEVEGCYGVRPNHTDEAAFATAHEQLEELLPGAGALSERYEQWEKSIRVPRDRHARPLRAARGRGRAGARRSRARRRHRVRSRLIRFLGEPTSRTYVITYPAGQELCRAYVAGESERFHRLLTEQVRVRGLVAARDGSP